jgi:methionine-rich copper-binding protein CopC
VLSFAVLIFTAVVTPSVALAHARYKTSTPGVGEIVQDSPTQVDITFTQNVQKVAGAYDLAVTRDGGGPVTSGPVTLDDQDRSKMSVALQADLPPGRYVARWKNVSDDDGDPLEGAFSFYIRTQPTQADLANDQQLAQIGAVEEETPSSNETPVATARPGATGSAPSASPTATSGSDSGGSNTGLYIGIGVAVAIVLVAGGGWFTFMRGRP